MSEKALPGRAIFGWDSTNETWVKILVDTSGNLQITSTDLTTILSEIQHATYGLEAIKDAIDLIDVSGTADAVWDEAKSGHVTVGTFGKEVQDILTALEHGTYGLSAIEILVDEVETYLKHATYGLSALDTDLGTIIAKTNNLPSDPADESLIEAAITTAHSTTDGLIAALNNLAQSDILNDATPFSGADIGVIKGYIESATYGLSALETLVDEVESLLKDGTYGLSALDTDLGTLLTRLSATRAGYLDELDFGLAEYLEDLRQKATTPSWNQDTDSLEAISEAIATVSGKTTNLPSDPADESLVEAAITSAHSTTDGLITTVSGVADAIQTKTDNLPTDPADASDIAADFDRHLSHVDFWSVTDDVIPITATADQDYNLPDVIVPALPTGATIYKVYLLFKCALIRDTSGSNNGIDEAGLIRIKASGDANFDDNGVTAYTILDNMWLVDVTNVGRDRGGDAFVGDTDISAKVTGADTYNIRLDSISADGANLELHEVCVGLRIYFY